MQFLKRFRALNLLLDFDYYKTTLTTGEANKPKQIDMKLIGSSGGVSGISGPAGPLVLPGPPGLPPSSSLKRTGSDTPVELHRWRCPRVTCQRAFGARVHALALARPAVCALPCVFFLLRLPKSFDNLHLIFFYTAEKTPD